MINFFIIGVGRSGTSLLQSMLSSHSKIAMPPETGFLRNAYFSFKKHENSSLEELVEQYPRLERITKLVLVNLSKQFSDEQAFYCFLLETVLSGSDAEIAGDKDPRLVEYISASSKIFPKVRFIHLVRDPRDVLLSKKKAEWSKDRPSWYHIFANYVQLKIGESAGKDLSKERYLVITYENILNTPEATISDICAFLNLDFEPAMLSFQEKAEELVSEDEQQWKKETMGPLLTANTGKWKGELANWEVALTEKLCKEAFDIGDYQNSHAISHLSFREKMYVKIVTVLLKGMGYPYMLYRNFYQKLILWLKK